MKLSPSFLRQRGFTLMETVIAIGVVAVLLTGFLIVFTPAAEGIKKSISIQEADRLVAALEQELVNVRSGETPVDAALTGFDRARQRIKYSTGEIDGNLDDDDQTRIDDKALLVYQYRGNPSILRSDGSPMPVFSTKNMTAGKDYTLVPIMRRVDSEFFNKGNKVDDDLKAIEGSVYLVKCVQMVHAADTANPGQYALKPLPVGGKQRGKIYDPAPIPADPSEIDDAAPYPDAVIAFAAEFYPCPTKSAGFFDGTGFEEFYGRAVKPVFTRNLAIRR